MKIKFGVSSNIKKEETIKQAKLVLFKAMVKMHELATLNAPVDTGMLRSSIKLFPSTPGATEYVLADGVEYGIHLEFGTSPHYVSGKNLEAWAKRVLGNKGAAYAVARKIAMKGVEAKPFFRPALFQVKEIWIPRYFNQVFSKK